MNDSLSGDPLRIAEAMLFAAAEPLHERDLARFLPKECDIPALLKELQEFYAPRGVNLVQVAGKWMLRTAEDLRFILRREKDSPRKLSRAALETLAIIAYHQPITRAEIQEMRGVQFFPKGVMDSLMESGWIRLRGRKQIPGRPVLYGVSEAFLTHFGLESARDLPGLAEMREAGLLEAMPPGMAQKEPEADGDSSSEEEEETPSADSEQAAGE